MRVLTGIKPTGTPHIGNYLGAIRPAILRSKEAGIESFLFIANYHALTTIHDGALLKKYCEEIAATWLALGLDPEKTLFFRQSDIPEIMELSWILACFTAKGLMNRAHAYKFLTTQNDENGGDIDHGINMGIYTYPILMAADILIFQSDEVPVGFDQIQHLEMTRDIAKAFNSRYGEVLKLPKAKIEEKIATIPGTDGRKMSKSYQNTIPIFLPEKDLRKAIMRIKTDSLPPHEPKDPTNSILYTLYEAIALPSEVEILHEKYCKGIGWGEVKEILYLKLNEVLTPARENYNKLLSERSELESILVEGAIKARKQASETLDKVRHIIGTKY